MYRYTVKPFSDSLWSEIKSRVEKIKKTEDPPYIATFDADGTLWDIDVGELFFEYQIKHCGLSLPPNPMAHYEKMRVEKPFEALVWLSQINKGVPLKKLQGWASECYELKKAEIPVLQSMKVLIDFLHKNDFQTYIVTASVKWSVEPFAALFEIPPENVIGTTTVVKNGTVTDEIDLITYQDKKVEGIRIHIGKQPHLSAGNAFSDRFLIEYASHIPLAIQSNPTGTLHISELQTKELALKNGWLSHCFY
jgi:phosphoserine phosphatase